MLGFLADACVVYQQNRTAELGLHRAASVQHRLGVLGGVFITRKESVQGIDHDQGRALAGSANC